MSHLTIYTSNRMERLLEKLAEIVTHPLSSPSSPEVIVVQSKGMERWISLGLAQSIGICANIDFPFPKAFLKNLFRIYFSDTSSLDLFEPEVMTFRIMNLLESRIRMREFAPLEIYLEERSDPARYYAISTKIADLFDQYLVFRPEMIFRWESGYESHWQAILWRDLASSGSSGHVAAMQQRLIHEMRTMPTRIGHHFERISLFGISYLPPFFLAVFDEMARRIPVNFFLMNPCREFWSDIVSEREEQRISKQYQARFSDRKSLHLEHGNRLLSSWGGQGKGFLFLIHSLETETHELFQDPGGESILSCIQQDIYSLSDISELNVPPLTPKPEQIASDSSIKIHSCHSPMREMEILFDALLDMFEKDVTLKPSEIFIMAPDIESYAPFIHAVFGSADDTRLRIPYRIADRSILRQSRLVEGFISILDLPDSRMSAPQLTGILGFESIRRRFGISLEDTGTIKRWIRETGVRWGFDERDRENKGVPPFSENTWVKSIERLLLGYAMPKRDDSHFYGVVPFDPGEGEGADILDKFLNFFDTLIYFVNEFKKDRTIENWSVLFNRLLYDLMETEDFQEPGFQFILKALARMRRAATLARFEEELNFRVIRSYLKEHLEKEETGHRFISEGITFCTLLPMRSIPAKFIGLVGMNHHAFPREEVHHSFDLISAHRRAGDRSNREDDKYLFLEAILSARRRLHISYVGQNIQDNSSIPPSVLVGQLMEYASERFGVPKASFLTHHRLHPFSPSYFIGEGPLLSYSSENFETATARYSGPNPRAFVDTPLSVADSEIESLDLESFCSFFINPSAFFMKHRLGIFLSEGESPLPESENFNLSRLDAYQLSCKLIEKHLKQMDVMSLYDIWRLEGRLPHGNTGRSIFLKLFQELQAFSRKIRNLTGEGPQKHLSGIIHLKNIRLVCDIGSISRNGMFRYRYVKRRARDLLDTWIRHLCYCILWEKNYPAVSHFLCREGHSIFKTVVDPKLILNSLLELFLQGLSSPLQLFPEASFEYAWSLYRNHRSPEAAFSRAKKKFEGNDYSPGEIQDLYIERCFGGRNPLSPPFESTSSRVFNPLIDHLEKGSVS